MADRISRICRIYYQRRIHEPRKKQASDKSLLIEAALKQAVTDALDKKSRLGQYAVLWENNHLIYKGSDAPEISRK